MRWIIRIITLVLIEVLLMTGTCRFAFGLTRESSIGIACFILLLIITFSLGCVFEWKFSFIKWNHEYKDLPVIADDLSFDTEYKDESDYINESESIYGGWNSLKERKEGEK